MSASPTDIITYVGVPLAVLGVTPIFYVAGKTVALYWNIRGSTKNIKNVYLHMSVLSGAVEVHIPVATLEPLDRTQPEYWEINGNHSELKGGSWTMLKWKETYTEVVRHYTHVNMYRLRQPQAKISFGKLVTFLMDRGAVLDPRGISTLRETGLRAPPETVLFRDNDGAPVLVITAPEEDSVPDAIPLALRWTNSYSTRSASSPRVDQIRVNGLHEVRKATAIRSMSLNELAGGGNGQPATSGNTSKEKGPNRQMPDPDSADKAPGQQIFHVGDPSQGNVMESEVQVSPVGDPRKGSVMDSGLQNTQVDDPGQGSVLESEDSADELGLNHFFGLSNDSSTNEEISMPLQELKSNNPFKVQNASMPAIITAPVMTISSIDAAASIPILLSFDQYGLKEAYFEGAEANNESHDRFEHVKPTTASQSARFSSGARSPTMSRAHFTSTARSSTASSTWFGSAVRSSMVSQGVFCRYVIPQEIARIVHNVGMDKNCAPCGVLILLGIRLQEDEERWKPRDYFSEVFAKEQEFRNELAWKRRGKSFEEAVEWGKRYNEADWQAKREAVPNALRSPGCSLKICSEDSLKWLKREKAVEERTSFERVVECILYQMLTQASHAADVVLILGLIQRWTERGGMNPSDYEIVKANTRAFVHACLLLYSIDEYIATKNNEGIQDLEECLQMWETVYIG